MSTEPITLADEQLERLAELIAARLQPSAPKPAAYVTAEELAVILAVDKKTIYRNADQLGAVRAGRRLRFDPAVAANGCSTLQAAPEKTTGTKRNPKPGTTDASLLPIGRRSR